MSLDIKTIADTRSLGAALSIIGKYTVIAHWKQGEFHHDLVIKTMNDEIIVITTNCNGGIKEVIQFESMPDRSALWHWRVPNSPEFSGELPKIIGWATTEHFFNSEELLREDARSELKEEYKKRQEGGGWISTVEESCSIKNK